MTVEPAGRETGEDKAGNAQPPVGAADTAVSLVVEGRRISRIFTVRNPGKLARLDAETLLTR